MIKIDHLSKKFNDNVVLDDISLDIKKGDVVGIIGPSGTGKSTPSSLREPPGNTGTGHCDHRG